MGHAASRNEQFENIARLRDEFWDSPNPIISMDSKKKELLGTYYYREFLSGETDIPSSCAAEFSDNDDVSEGFESIGLHRLTQEVVR